MNTYAAVIQKNDRWWIGWVEEIPGVNSQGESRKELIENLRSAVEEALELNRKDAVAAAIGDYTEETIAV
jgi:predicted RNase H-like HicB family nuclease